MNSLESNKDQEKTTPEVNETPQVEATESVAVEVPETNGQQEEVAAVKEEDVVVQAEEPAEAIIETEPAVEVETPAEVEITVVETEAETLVEVVETAAAETETLVEAEVAVTENAPADTPSANNTDYNAYERAELIQKLHELLEKNIDEVKEDVELIKQVFYKKQKAAVEEQKKLFLENGGEAQDFKPEKDDLEDKLKALMGDFRAKKAAQTARLEQERENNLLQKQHIIEQMKTLTETTDDVSSHIGEFKDLQQRWKSIGPVGASVSADLWKHYNLLQEKFWDLVKINNELREYDFKKNLEAKILLCEAAEKLIGETEVVAASRQLQKLHEEWREIGPVARDLREEIWNRFKDATSAINKKHQTYFEDLRKNEEENLEKKTALCEKIEAVDVSELKTYNAWDQATNTITEYQEEWRTIGFAPRKANQKIFERYRAACDAFYSAKNKFYKDAKAELNENLDKKRALCEKAEALKDSTDWKDTSDKLIKIQKEWKEVGPVSKKYSDELWKRFIAACDYFFEQKNKQTAGQRSEEQDNLKKKQDIIARIDALDTENPTKAYADLKELIEEWRNVGHVPFKDKDKIYKTYRTAIDKQFDKLNIDANNRRLDTFRTNLEDMSSKGEQKLYREREKLVRTYEHLKSEIATYENNMGFFSATSKRADNLLKEMENKIEKLKEECLLIEKKINMIEDKL